MPDLDPTLELAFGQRLSISQPAQQDERRAAPSTARRRSDGLRSVHHAGWLFHPHVNVDLKDVPVP